MSGDGFQLKITGAEELLGKLDEIAQDTKFKSARLALRKASQVIAEKAKEGARRIDDPKTAELIAANIVASFSAKHLKQTGELKFRIGVLGGAKSYANTRLNRRKRRVGEKYKTDGDSGNPGGDTFYWRFWEFGTKKMRARPFMRPALANNAQLAINTFVSEYEKAVDRAIRRAKKKRLKD